MFSALTSFMASIKQTVVQTTQTATNLSEARINPLANIGRNSIIYARTSTEEQNLEAQIYSCEEFCFNNRLYIKEIIQEQCTAFKDEKSQAGLKKIIESNEDVNLVVFSIDRFSRNISKATELVKLMEQKRINLISVKENISLSTAYGKHEFRKLLSASQYEAELISERVQNSVKYRRAHGIHMGPVPYGYTLFNKKLARNNEEQMVIRFILTTVKKTTTVDKLNVNIKKLLKDLKIEGTFTPVIITMEDDQYEYRQMSNDEKFQPTIKAVSEMLNEYGIKKRNKLWTASAVNYIIQQQLKNNQKDIQNMRF